MPRAPFESAADVAIRIQRLRSKLKATKVMVMGIIAMPVANKFDGKALCLSISEKYGAMKNAYNCNFSTDYHINDALKNGEWRALCSPYEYHDQILTSEAFEMISECYKINPSFDLCFSYKTQHLAAHTSGSELQMNLL